MENYKTIERWQVEAYYEPWQVEYLEDNIIRVTDSVNGSICIFKVVGDNTDPIELLYPKTIIKIKQPIPTEIAWHELTSWRHAKRLYVQYPDVWNAWKKKGLIPIRVLKRVEEDPTPVGGGD